MNDNDNNTDDDIWHGDLLGFAKRGTAFTSLITSIDDHRTISIEAGYGHGKTFFRKRWARQLEAAGECVIQIDARLSDHSGDPVVTFLGALLKKIPAAEKSKVEKGLATGQRILMATGKAVAKATLREGATELAEVFEGEDGEASLLTDIAKSAGQDLSKAAGDIIAAQLSAEKAREELGQQLQNLHAQITEGRDTNRIIILIDELDRCHPDYAIALLEAMKLVFDQDGFIFVLMVNRDYLENIAAHRFGGRVEGEYYIDKFVDLRQKLSSDYVAISQAAGFLTSKLPVKFPFTDHESFSVERAGDLASTLASKSELSMRQIERLLVRVEIACRLYQKYPIDVVLLAYLAFVEACPALEDDFDHTSYLPRLGLTPEVGREFSPSKKRDFARLVLPNSPDKEPTTEEIEAANIFAKQRFSEFFVLPIMNEIADQPWEIVYRNIASRHIPEHQAMLEAVYRFQA